MSTQEQRIILRVTNKDGFLSLLQIKYSAYVRYYKISTKLEPKHFPTSGSFYQGLIAPYYKSCLVS